MDLNLLGAWVWELFQLGAVLFGAWLVIRDLRRLRVDRYVTAAFLGGVGLVLMVAPGYPGALTMCGVVLIYLRWRFPVQDAR